MSTRSRKHRLTQTARLVRVEQLESREVPATFTAVIDPTLNNTAAVEEIRGFFEKANSNADLDDTINFFAGGKYIFNDASPTRYGTFDGGTALHVFYDPTGKESLTVNGNGATLFRPAGAPSFRFFRAVGDVTPGAVNGPTVFLNNLTFTGGNTFDVGTAILCKLCREAVDFLNLTAGPLDWTTRP